MYSHSFSITNSLIILFHIFLCVCVCAKCCIKRNDHEMGKEIHQGHIIHSNVKQWQKHTFFIVFVHLIHLKHESYEYVINELASKSTPTSNMTPYLRKPLLLTMFHQTTFAIIIFHVLFRTFALWLGNRKVLLQTSTKLFLVDFLCVCVYWVFIVSRSVCYCTDFMSVALANVFDPD